MVLHSGKVGLLSLLVNEIKLAIFYFLWTGLIGCLMRVILNKFLHFCGKLCCRSREGQSEAPQAFEDQTGSWSQHSSGA